MPSAESATPSDRSPGRDVYLHLGLPKTGTSYLQTIVWAHRPALRAAGLLVPGRERRDHLWSSLAVRDDDGLARRGPRAPQAWSTLLDEIEGDDADVLVSHEFFAAASAEQAQRTADALLRAAGPDARLHLVLTAREPLSLFTSSWQEHLKNKGTTPMADYAREVSEDPAAIWNWRTLDLRLVLERWAPVTAPERVHVLTPPERDLPRAELWHRFAGVLGLPPLDLADAGFANSSMGLAEAETLRRVNGRLQGFGRAFDRGVWIRSFLADDRLVPRRGEPFWPSADRIEECRRRGDDALAHLAAHDYDVVGDPETLRVPAELPPRRTPDSVTDAEVAEVAVDLVAELLGEVRARHRPGHDDEGSAAPAPSPAPRSPSAGPLRRAARRLSRRSG